MTVTSTTRPPRTLPLVDLDDARREAPERLLALRRLRSAAHELGFFYVVGRGIPQQVQDDLLTASRLFFAQPNEVNAEVANLRSPHLRGRTRVATEHTDGAPDLRE